MITSGEYRDTTGRTKLMQDYNMYNYDTRIARYIPPEPKQNTASKPIDIRTKNR
jgi:hypothetical protein